MDMIYERAWLTIIASYGHNAHAGLPGVERGSRKGSRNTVNITPGVSLGFLTGLDKTIKTSMYSSRAWT